MLLLAVWATGPFCPFKKDTCYILRPGKRAELRNTVVRHPEPRAAFIRGPNGTVIYSSEQGGILERKAFKERFHQPSRCSAAMAPV